MDWICEKLQRREKGVLKQLTYLGLMGTEKSSSRSKTPSPGLERAGQRWIREEDALLKDLYSERWPIAEIAARMQRSEYAIYCRMEKLQLFGAEYGYPANEELPRWSKENNRLLREMYQAGKSVNELADYFERTENSIRARLFYMGLSRESPISILPKKS